MRRLAMVLLLLVLVPTLAPACPLCREAISQTTAAEKLDQTREAVAYNRSIYLMLTVPCLALGVLGFCMYRSVRNQNPPAE